MPLVLQYLSSFGRSIKALDANQTEIIERIIACLEIYYSSGCNIDQVYKKETRFFYKKLRNEYYEAGIEGKLRVVLRKDGSTCSAILVGNHDQIRKFLS